MLKKLREELTEAINYAIGSDLERLKHGIESVRENNGKIESEIKVIKETQLKFAQKISKLEGEFGGLAENTWQKLEPPSKE